MIGDSKKNKWCCFCKYWFDPACKALTPRNGKNFYDIDKDMKSKCNKTNLETRAIAICSKFERKEI